MFPDTRSFVFTKFLGNLSVTAPLIVTRLRQEQENGIQAPGQGSWTADVKSLLTT